jgi:K+/H+ antiporter YhaU regulatory subunit KhtT
MHFTEQIISGKSAKIVELEKWLEDKTIECEGHLAAFTNMKDMKEELDNIVAKKIEEAEKHSDIMHKMMIKNHALEKRNEEGLELNKNMNR